MNEDIEIIKKHYVFTTNHVLDDKNKQFKQAIENLINKYKEQEKHIKALDSVIVEHIEKNKEQEKMIELALDCLSVWAMCADDEGCFCTVKGKECNVVANEIEGQEHTTCKECILDYFRKKAKGE